MKKSIILSILSLTISSTLSQGGSIPFNTYLANNDDGIITTYGNGPWIGQGIDDTFTGLLLYSVNPIVEDATGPLVSTQGPLNPDWTVGSTGTFNYHFSTGVFVPAGYILAPNFNYSGSETTLYFEVAAFQGPYYGAFEGYHGHSASFTATLVTGTTLPTPDQLDNLQPFQVFIIIPEPSTLVLGSLGLSALFLFRRKQS
jgi:hypothetical protein